MDGHDGCQGRQKFSHVTHTAGDTETYRKHEIEICLTISYPLEASVEAT